MNTSKIRPLLNLMMTFVLLMLMSYTLLGARAHEWLGIGMVGLCLAHHAMNWRWHKNLIRGNYSAWRVLQVAINGLILLAIVGLLGSGMVMSLYVFRFLDIQTGAAEARSIHMFCSYWAFVLMSVHIGFHGNQICGRLRKGTAVLGKMAETWLPRVIIAGLAVYGIYSFYTRDMAGYLLMQNEFAFFDFNESLMGFYFDYFSIMVFLTVMGYSLSGTAIRYGAK